MNNMQETTANADIPIEQEDIPVPTTLFDTLIIPHKTLLGPGPSNCPNTVLQVASTPLVGHMHKECFRVMDDIKLGLQYAFQTRNPFTLAISATGHGGMETCLGNLLEKGDVALITVTGIWGERAADMATRYGADVKKLVKPAGQAVTLQEVEDKLIEHKPTLLFITHGESSTGVMQPLHLGLGELCHRYNCLLVVDTVASLGGTPFFTDRWEIDACYSGSQKVLGSPPGLAPLTLSTRALNKLRARKTPPPVFYFDLNMIGNYWGCDDQPRRYHHTIPVTSIYTLREALVILAREGLPSYWTRHAKASQVFQQGLSALGFKCFVEQADLRLPTINAIIPPQGINIPQLQLYAMEKHNVEIAGGLGPTAGKILRIGLMGVNGTEHHAQLALKVLKVGSEAQGLKFDPKL